MTQLSAQSDECHKGCITSCYLLYTRHHLQAGFSGSSNPAPPAFTTAAAPFVRIKGGSLQIVRMPDDLQQSERRLRVIAILGKARMGKSTFLNCVFAQATGATADVPVPFQMSSGDDHITRGMDAAFIPSSALTASIGSNCEDNVLLLDCQGLGLDSSAHDPALLLSTYLLADVIVFNETRMLLNETLNILSPVCTFANVLGSPSSTASDDGKPSLIFRVSDAEKTNVGPAAAARLLEKQQDQFQSIRDSLCTLFTDPIGGIRTLAIERSHKEGLKTGDGRQGIARLLSDSELGFSQATRTVLTTGRGRRSGKEWVAFARHVMGQVNTGGKISLDKLDVVRQAARGDMHEWITGLPVDLFTPLTVDAMQATFAAQVEPRKAAIAKTLAAFDERHKLIGAEMRATVRAELLRKLVEPINAAAAAATAAAESILAPIAARVRADTPPAGLAVICVNEAAALSQQYAVLRSALRAHLKTLRDAAGPLYRPVASIQLAWASEQAASLERALKAHQEAEEKDVAAIAREVTSLSSSLGPRLLSGLRSTAVIDVNNRADLLLPRSEVASRLVRHVVMTNCSVAFNAMSSCLALDVCGGGVRVVRYDAESQQPSLAQWLERSVDIVSGSDVAFWRRVASNQCAGLQEAMGAKAQQRVHGRERLMSALFAGQISPTHAVLGSLSTAIKADVEPAACAADGPVMAALDAMIESALHGVYEVAAANGSGNTMAGVPTFLLQVQRTHPNLHLTSLELECGAEAESNTQPAVLMLQGTYQATWAVALDRTTEKMLELDFASDVEDVERFIHKLPAEPEKGLPVSRIRTLANAEDDNRAIAASRTVSVTYNPYLHRYRTRGKHSLLPQLFHQQLKEVLARDDAERDDENRLFSQCDWRPLEEAFPASR